jgi:hypothetical protein
MLHDLMPDVVTISFGARTDTICKRLRSRGWSSVGTGEWQGERVLGVSFAGDRRATSTADDLLAALIAVVGELEIAETRVWEPPRRFSPPLPADAKRKAPERNAPGPFS